MHGITMNIRIMSLTPLILVTTLLANQGAVAAKIYQWTDAEGVVQFSDISPLDNAPTEIQEINITSYAVSSDESDEYSIVNQLEWMATWRRQREEEYLARRQIQLEEMRLAQERNSYQLIEIPSTQVYYPSAYYYAYPGNFSYPGNFGGYNKGYGNHWNINHHFSSGHGNSVNHRNHGNSSQYYPQYKPATGSRF